MGRTYKKNDLHRSRRPKSIREKRNFSNKKSSNDFDNQDQRQQKHYKDFTNIDYTEEDWLTMDDVLNLDWIDDILNETDCSNLPEFDLTFDDESSLTEVTHTEGNYWWANLSNSIRNPPLVLNYGRNVENTSGGMITTVALSLDRLIIINNA